MPRCMARCRNRHDAAVAEQVVLAVNVLDRVAVVDIGLVEPDFARRSGSLTASHSLFCTTIVALGTNPLPPE